MSERTPAMERACKKLRKAMDAVLDQARKEGISRPAFYFEGDGLAYVMDRDSPHYDSERGAVVQKAIYVRACILPEGSDMGGW